MKEVSAAEIRAFQKKILAWYKQHERPLPWRTTRDPYCIWVSEVMSQQTQIDRVVVKYKEWMERFPTLKDLASASSKDVLAIWSGLGYNRRALYLYNGAKTVLETYHGLFPRDISLLRKIPGIGEYTASAILCFAFNIQIPVIDTNIRKVISIEFNNGMAVKEDVLKEFVKKLIPDNRARDWNQALMDYAALVLHKEKNPSASKQSRFKDSDRYYRGYILRVLLKRAYAEDELYMTIADRIDKPRFEKILQTLIRDHLIIQNTLSGMLSL